MKRPCANGRYCLLLPIGLVVALAGVDIARHHLVYASHQVPPHAHVAVEHLLLGGFFLLLYATGRLGGYQLNLRLCFLSLLLVSAKLGYEMTRAQWETAALFDLATFALLVPLLIFLAIYPVRALMAEAREEHS